MKKFLFGLATLALLASCSQNETLEVSKGNAIDFQNAFVGNATRSVNDPSYNMTKENLTDFAVYGFMNEASGVVFTDELVSKQDGKWSYQNTQYWTPDNTYYFAALAPGDANTREWTLTQASGDAAKLGIGTVNFENHGTQDLLYWANVYVNDANNNQAENPVAITFNHLLSKVKFTFKNGLANANASIRVNDITITNAHTNATINLATNNWWTNLNAWVINENITERFLFGNAAAGSTINDVEPITQNASQESFNELLLFPQENEELSITFSIDLLYGDQVADTYAHDLTITQTLKMGYSYNFKATIDETNIIDPDDTEHPDKDMKEITFTVETIKDWVQPNEVTIPAGQDTPAQP